VQKCPKRWKNDLKMLKNDVKNKKNAFKAKNAKNAKDINILTLIIWYIFFLYERYDSQVREKYEFGQNRKLSEHGFTHVSYVIIFFILNCTQIWTLKDHVLYSCIQQYVLIILKITPSAGYWRLVGGGHMQYIIAHTKTHIIDIRGYRHPFNVRHLSIIISENANGFEQIWLRITNFKSLKNNLCGEKLYFFIIFIKCLYSFVWQHSFKFYIAKLDLILTVFRSIKSNTQPNVSNYRLL